MATREILELKDKLQAMQQVQQLLMNMLEQLPELLESKEKRICHTFDSMLPLLALKNISQLDNVIGFMDKEGLYLAKKASISIKQSPAA